MNEITIVAHKNEEIHVLCPRCGRGIVLEHDYSVPEHTILAKPGSHNTKRCRGIGHRFNVVIAEKPAKN